MSLEFGVLCGKLAINLPGRIDSVKVQRRCVWDSDRQSNAVVVRRWIYRFITILFL